MLIIGIDEGLANCGFCLLRFDAKGRVSVVVADHFKTKASQSTETRLKLIYGHLQELYETYRRADEEVIIATEELFMGDTKSGLNHRSTSIIKTAMVYGVIALFCGRHGVDKVGIPPVTVKKRCTGSGKATKEDVMAFVKRRFRRRSEFKSDHVCDAAAIALTAYELHKEASRETSC